MNVTLTPEVQKFVEEQVKAGRYDSAEAVIAAAVARLQTEEELSSRDVRELREELDVGTTEADRGEFTDFTAEEIIAERRAARSGKRQGR